MIRKVMIYKEEPLNYISNEVSIEDISNNLNYAYVYNGYVYSTSPFGGFLTGTNPDGFEEWTFCLDNKLESVRRAVNAGHEVFEYDHVDEFRNLKRQNIGTVYDRMRKHKR